MKKFTLLFLLLNVSFLFAQKEISGVVKDNAGNGLPGVNIIEKGSSNGVSTDIDGAYKIKVKDGATLVFSYVGFSNVEKAATSNSINVTLSENGGQNLDEVVVVGTRTAPRSNTTTALPVDVLSAKDLTSTGQASFDKALQYRVPSFNTVNTPVNDATSLLDPYEIRNMGPSRTLILINGKRKNLSSLLYVQFSPGRGETGVDLSAIPTDAIKRVEILRDGASAQYGSDAIAGVMNVILKDKYDYTSLNINSGVTSKGDGQNYGVSFNSGANLANKGFINYTIALNQTANAVRSGKIDLRTEIATFGGTPAQDALITNYLKDYPTGNNINGTSESNSAKFLINLGIPIGNENELYANAAFITKSVLSNANFRTPYWRQDRGLLHSTSDHGGRNYITAATLAFPSDNVDIYKGYIGYMPTFEGLLLDYNATLGVKGTTNGWKHDASLTVGGNKQSYTVDNTINRGLGVDSPTRFKPGGYGFNHIVGNIDLSKAITDKFSIGIGMEARTESYTIVAGDDKSFEGEGSNSFPGINKENAGTNSRYNIGGYLDLSYDVTDALLVNGTYRHEKYSDFGNADVWKLSSRYKILGDKFVIRGSASTGFRAPTLHQIYAQSTQAAFVGGTIQLSGLFNNKSKQARLLGIPSLKPEKSTNYSVGLGITPIKNMSVTLDYFTIGVKDRIVYSSSISSSNPASVLGQILSQAGVKTVQFFINGIETKTSGLDYVVGYKNIKLGQGKLGLNLAGNVIVENKIIGTPAEPKAISDAGSSILNTQIKSLLTNSRPKYKSIFGFDYQLNKWNLSVNNTLFGPTSFQDLDNGGSIMEHVKAEFKPATVTDLSIGYMFNDKLSITANVNNLFNILPKWDLVSLDATGAAAIADPQDKALLRGFLGFSGRYDILGYNGSQFSQLGAMYNVSLNYKF